MKINFDRLHNTAIDGFKTVLIFGNSKSVLERAKRYIISNKKFVTDINEKQYLEGSTLQQPGLFEDTTAKCPLVTGATDKSYKKWKTTDPSSEIVFQSSSLKTSSAFVKTLQASSNGLAIGCYDCVLLRPEFEFYIKKYDLDKTMKAELYQRFKNIPEDFFNFLGIYEIIFDHEGTTAIESLMNLLPREGSFPQTNPILLNSKSFLSQQFDPSNDSQILHLRAMCKTIYTLYALKSYGYKKEKVSPPIFFKDESLYLAAARRWKLSGLKGNNELFMELEEKVKGGNLKQFDYQMFHMEHLNG